MTRLEAWRRFEERTDRDVFPEERPGEFVHDGIDWWPFLMAAACELSGRLRRCRTEADLDAAVAAHQDAYDESAAAWEQWDKLAARIAREVWNLGVSGLTRKRVRAFACAN